MAKMYRSDTPDVASLLAPKFDSGEMTAEELRLHRKQRLTGALRLFGRLGFGEGVAGHITARDPEHTDMFWVNPFGMNFRHIKVSDLLLVNEAGEVVEGNQPLNRAAFAIHSQVHKARPDAVAAAHSHSLYGKAWSAMHKPLDMLTQDSCAFYNDHAVFDDYTGVVVDTGEGERIADALGDKKALILTNHGNLTVGRSVEEAAWWFITMERTCQAQLLADAAGEPKKIKPEVAELTHSQVGSNMAGWFSFQPLWDEILRDQPDFLD